ncbi:transcriptional regulator [Corynebacterium humireducens NBRC 106098 = DSM 45392]|uniref:Transcriptional regulator n=1 Tax=Corynebacterium humireducens NBRC 106098 = DSM 45392 TaxID=1223515 RepID=A0A0B5D535_9CORY|nr:LuxR C-terminal-related transcriptional regulator [Corynebacterium humireducens]AJE33891.1 transcriptional regulator [Corynebacterium humireducens NBRC 106098 = DSM 45392]
MHSSRNLGPQQTSGSLLRTVIDEVTELPPGGGLLTLVTGPVGAGKSSLLRQLSRALPGWSGIRVSALSWHAQNEGELLAQILGRADHAGPLTGLVDRDGARTALLIDDVHWADVTSLRELVDATRRLRKGSLAVIMTASDHDDASDDLPMSHLREIVDTALTLAPLDVEDVSALALHSIGAHLSPLAAAELRDLTGGRPGLIQEVLQAAPADHWRLSNPQIPLPKPWRAALARRTRGLDVGAVLAAVAVLPGTGTGTPDLVRFLADDLDGSLLDAAVTADLLELLPSSGDPVLSFTHPTDRAVIRATTGPAQVRRLHRRAAQYHRAYHNIDAALIHEALSAEGTDDATARQLAERGEQLGAAGQWLDAADAFTLAAKVASHPDVSHDQHLNSIEALLAAADIPRARLHAGSLSRAVRDVKVDSVRSYLALHEGRRNEAVSLIDRAWDTLEETRSTDAALRTRVASRKVLIHLADWEPEKVIHWAGVTDDWAPETSASRLQAQYISLVGRSALTRSIPSDVPLPGETPALAQRRNMAAGWIHLVHDDPVAARRYLQFNPGNEGSERISLWMDAWLARTQFLLGEYREAERTVERGLARAERFGIRFLEPLLLWTGSQVAAYRGDRELSRAYINRLTFSHDAFAIQRIPSAMCRLLVGSIEGDASSLERAGETLVNISRETDISQPGFWPWEDVWAQHLVLTGRIDDADDLTSRAEERAAESGIGSLHAKLAVPRAGILMQHGDIEGGIRRFEEAVEQIESLTMPTYQARILYEYGRVLRRLGRRRQADEIFARAGDVFAAMGATEFVNRCNRERRAGGLGTRTTGAGGLTPQEQEIAKLVAEGATNREVARELFLSTKTVEYHLTRVYRKLGVRTRNELPRVLDEL